YTADEEAYKYNLTGRRPAPAVVNVFSRCLNTKSYDQLEILTLGSLVIKDYGGYIISNKHAISETDDIIAVSV
ncbi:outer membrane-stress sensor serine endopeptidase DegS, partial [Escherichia coli]|nr:outer membrane-stress sensor serine endopeptidase DegS [Escherichia coli]